jgi:hypothetical protein
MMLQEGETYHFLYYKTTVFPDGEEYYILESPFKSKHLLPKKTYAHYNFKLNQEIKCIVDKINCSSRIFLEPEHPVYKINGVYEMTFIRKDSISNSKGIKKDSIILSDKNGYKYTCVPINNLTDKDYTSLIKFRLLRIKKGILYIHII